MIIHPTGQRLGTRMVTRTPADEQTRARLATRHDLLSGPTLVADTVTVGVLR